MNSDAHFSSVNFSMGKLGRDGNRITVLRLNISKHDFASLLDQVFGSLLTAFGIKPLILTFKTAFSIKPLILTYNDLPNQVFACLLNPIITYIS